MTRRERLLAGLFFLGPPLLLLWTSLAGDRVPSGADLLFATPFFAERAPPGFTRPANPLAFDLAYQFVPWRHFAWESLRQGRLPLWNPYSLAGTPFVATMQSAVFYPINLLFTALPFARTFAWSALVRLWIAGFSTYLLARFHAVSRTGALVAGVSFMLCGYVIVWLGHPHTNVAVWLPALALAGERLLAAESGVRRLSATALLAALVGIQFTGGHIETSVDVLFGLGVYYGLRWWQVARRRQLGLVVLPAVGIALGTALAGVQLLPFLEWLPLSAEYQSRPPAAVTLFDPRCWHELLALPLALFPNLYGNPTWPGPYRPYLPWGNYNENVLYVGTLPLLCALVALRFRREPASPVRALALLVLVAAGMALHLPVLDWLNALPGIARANPARLRLVTSFALAVLAGFGADAVLEGGPAARRWFVGLAALVVAAGVLLAAGSNILLPPLVPHLAVWGRHVVEARYAALPAPVHPLEYYYEELDAVLAGMVTAFRVGHLAMYAPALVALGGWVLARGSARGPMLVVLSVGELIGLGRGYTPAVPRRDFYPTTPVLSRLASDTTLHRMTALHQDLIPDTHMMYELADVRGLDLPTRWYAAYFDAAGRQPWVAAASLLGSVDSPLLRVLNVKYVVGTGEPPPGVRAVEQHGAVYLAELARVQPRSFVVHEAVVADNDARTLELLRAAPDAVYSRVVISGPADVPPVVGDGNGEAAPIAYAPTETAWSVVTGAGGYLVNTDAYYPGWRAYVDGRPAALYRANLAFRAVLVPAGQHTVTFRYEPRSLHVGAVVSALAACVCVILTWRHPPPRNGRPAASGAPAVPGGSRAAR